MNLHQFAGAALIASCVFGFTSRISAAPGPAERVYLLGFAQNNGAPDERLFFGDGDWRYGFQKVECGLGFPTMVGLGAIDSGDGWQAESLLCATSNTIAVDYYNGVSMWFGPGTDHRLDTSTGDWAYGYDKAECANNQVLTGMAVQIEGINEFRCSAATTKRLATTLRATSCSVVDFNRHDGYDPHPGSNRGDWAYTVDKGNCGANRYIKGFAVVKNHSFGIYKPNKILCCGAQLTPSGYRCGEDEQCASGRCNTTGYCQ